MPIKGIIFMAVIFLIVAICFKNEIYNWITDLSKDENSEDDENNINEEENKGENT